MCRKKTMLVSLTLAALALAVQGSAIPRADYPFCPPSDSIAPCTCLQEDPQDARPSIVCQETDATTIAAVFGQTFPLNKLLAVRVFNSDLGVVGTDFFLGKEIQEIYISQSTITEVSADAFATTAATLSTLLIADSPTLAAFPWDSLTSYPSLKSLTIRGTAVGSIDSLPTIPTVTQLDFSNNGIATLPESLFVDFISLAELDLSKNSLGYLANYTMHFGTAEGDLIINLAQNQITGLDLLAFPVIKPYFRINLAQNAITTLDELSLKSVLDRLEYSIRADGSVDLFPGYDEVTGELLGNKIVCDCAINWFVTSSDDRKNRLKNAYCDYNKQPIIDIPSDYFSGIC